MSRHHILTGLSERYRVLWVAPPAYIEEWRRNGVTSSLAGRGLRKISDRMWCYASRLPADYKYRYVNGGLVANCFRAYHAQWRKAYVWRIKRLLREMGIEEVILYVWRPEFHWALGQFNERLTCYHIVDEYSFDPNRDHEISNEERKLLERSDLVFIHSKTLIEKKGHINPNTYEVANGVDFEFYQQSLKDGPPDPCDMTKIPHPRIGYMGHIKRHIDLPLLYDIAKARPAWSLVTIGPVRDEHADIKKDLVRLKALPNVHFLGGKPASELPLYINGLDICLMPYRKTNYTKYIYPLKMHEYFACGKPVVSTELENLKEFSDVLQFADNSNDWIASIERAIESISEQQAQRLIRIASHNSWASRVEKIVECLDMGYWSRCER
jgi:glycosyltransferase involved in cell wall biosynthesis